MVTLRERVKANENNVLSTNIVDASTNSKINIGVTFYENKDTHKLNFTQYSYTFTEVATSKETGKSYKDIVSTVKRNNYHDANVGMMTDYFYSAVNELAPRLAYIAVNTAYARSGHPMLYNLMNEMVQRVPDYRNDAFADYLAIDTNIDSYVCKSRNIGKERDYAHEQKMQYNVKHTKKLVVFPDGTKHFVEILPVTESKNTVFGQNTYAITSGNTSFSCEDLIQTAKEALLELACFDLLHSVNDIWTYRKYVYRKVNRALHSERSANAHNVPLYATVGNGDTEKPSFDVKTVGQVDKMLAHVERGAVIEYLNRIIENANEKETRYKGNIDGMKYAFKRVFVDGVTKADVAREKKVSKVTVNRWLNTCIKYLSESGVRSEVYDTLTSFIVG